MIPHDHDGEELEGQLTPIVITDKRHSRELEEAEEPAAPPAPAPAPEPPAASLPPAPPAGVVEFAKPATSEPAPAEPATEPAPEPGEEEMDEDAYAAAEMQHLRMLFGAGLVNYLRSQLGLLLNFAIIYLGRAPNPATGLVGTELDKAKLAIDLLEFTAARLKGQFPANEEQEITQVLAELKYTFLQLASSAPAPSNPGGGEA
jgi:hypothetical protein